MDFWISVWSSIMRSLTPAVIAAVILGLVRYVFRSLFDRHLDFKFNSKLKKFEAEINRSLREHEIRFSELHKKRAEVIAQLYIRLRRVESDFLFLNRHIISEQDPPEQDICKSFNCHSAEFNDFFRDNRIFLDEALSEQIDKFYSALGDGAGNYSYWKSARTDDKSDSYMRIHNEVIPKLNDIRQGIETRFRKLLGVDSDLLL